MQQPSSTARCQATTGARQQGWDCVCVCGLCACVCVCRYVCESCDPKPPNPHLSTHTLSQIEDCRLWVLTLCASLQLSLSSIQFRSCFINTEWSYAAQRKYKNQCFASTFISLIVSKFHLSAAETHHLSEDKHQPTWTEKSILTPK